MKKVAILVAICVVVLLVFVGSEALQTHATMPGAPGAPAPGMQASLNAAEVQGMSPEEPPDPETAGARVSVEGTPFATLVVEIVTKGSSRPMAGVSVILTPRDGNDEILGQRDGATDVQGKVRFDALAPGTVTVLAGPRTSLILGVPSVGLSAADRGANLAGRVSDSPNDR